MPDLNQQEQELVDLMRAKRQVWAYQELGKELGWGTGKLTQVLASLEERGLIETWKKQSYPGTKYCMLKR